MTNKSIILGIAAILIIVLAMCVLKNSKPCILTDQTGNIMEHTETAEEILTGNSVMVKFTMQAFQSVLLNETAFSCTDEMPYGSEGTFRRFEGFLNEMPYGYDNAKGVCRFAIVDLDGDAMPEVLLELEEYFGFMILRYREGQIYGNVLGYRSMNAINKDGIFQSEAGAF